MEEGDCKFFITLQINLRKNISLLEKRPFSYFLEIQDFVE